MLLDALAARGAVAGRRLAAAAVLAGALIAAVRWPKVLPPWAGERGDRTRAQLKAGFPAGQGAWPNVPPLRASSAPELVERFHLH